MQLGDRAANVYTTSVSVMSTRSTLEDLVLERGTGLCNATSIKSAEVEARIPAKIKPPTSEASGIPTKFLGSVFGKSLCTKVLR